jgi:hypothetical protein
VSISEAESLKLMLAISFAEAHHVDAAPDPAEKSSVAEPCHFYAAPGKNLDSAPTAAADPAPTPALILLYSKAKLLKGTEV